MMNCSLMIRLIVPSICLAFVVSTGCSITGFQHPLVKPEQAELPTELMGIYRTLKEDGKLDAESFTIIEPAGENHPSGFVRVKSVWKGKTERETRDEFLVFFGKTGDTYIAHLPLPKNQPDDDVSAFTDFQKEWKPDLVEAYLLFAVRKTQDGFEVYDLDNELLTEQIKGRKLAGRIKEPVQRPRRRGRHRKQHDLPPKPRIIETPKPFDAYDTLISERPEKLRTFFEANIEKLLADKPSRNVRIK